MAYTVHQAKTHFSRLLKEAEAGQEVVVMRGKTPVARLVAIDEKLAPASQRFLAGRYRGQIHYEEGTFDPMTDEELQVAGFDSLLNGPLVPSLDSPAAK